MTASTIETARARIALARDTAEDPNEVPSACQWCGVRTESGFPGTILTHHERIPKNRRGPRDSDTVEIADKRNTGRALRVYGWRRCGICSRSAQCSHSLAWAYVALDIASKRTLPLKYGKAAKQLGEEMSTSGDIVLYANLRGAHKHDPGTAESWEHLDPEAVEKWARRYAELKEMFAPASAAPCGVCGTTQKSEKDTDADGPCGECRSFIPGLFATLEDFAASRAAGLDQVRHGFGRYVDFRLAADHPNFRTDEPRGPWEFMADEDRDALRGLAERMERERAEAEQKRKAEAERSRAGRLRIPS